ncbi:MAG TPA: GAF domain-containing protein [Mycobacteriales bacterium]|nr:GAF domain-containing protein [Mycobacteriales bacterium]
MRQATDAAVEPARLRLDALLTELMERAGEVLETQGRLRSLLDAVVSIAQDPSLGAVLQRIASAACELVGARYGALGVLAADRRRLSDFITVGLTTEERAAIGELPTGKGILGVLIESPEPLCLAQLNADPRSFGFPPGHPPMSTFLGVPIRIRNQVFGNLYLTEKADGKPFTDEDQQLVVALAAAAGAAIQNAQLFDTQQRRQAWLSASNEVRAATFADLAPADLLDLVAEQGRTATGADCLVIGLPDAEGRLVIRAAAGQDANRLIGQSMSGPESIADQVLATAEHVVRTDRGGPGLVVGDDATCYRREVFAPLGAAEAGASFGVVGVGYARDDHNAADDLAFLLAYADQAAIALQLTRTRADRERLAILEDRDRIARDLHDLVIQRLFATGMTLQSAAPRVADLDARGRIATVIDDLDSTIRELRQAIYQLQTPVIEEDLRADIQRVVDEAAAVTTAKVRLHFVGPVASAVPEAIRPHLLAVLREGLSNAIRHADPTAVDVTVEADDHVSVTVADDGAGMDPSVSRRSGLANLQARAAEFDGTCELQAGDAGVGTRLVWQVPLPRG